jgi:hypothetical protein
MKSIKNTLVFSTLICLFALINMTKTKDLVSQDRYINKKIDELPEKIQKVLDDSEQVTEIVKNITGVGYEKIVQRSEYQKLEGLESEYYENFLDDFFNGFNLNFTEDKLEKIKNILLDILKTKNEKDNELRSFQIVYEDPEKQKLTALYLVVEYLVKSKEINLVYTSTSSEQTLQPNLLVIKTTKVQNGVNSEEMSIVEEENKLPKRDISAVLEYFEIVALKKCSENLNGNSTLNTDELRFLGEESSGFQDLIGGIDAVTKTWKNVVDAFKTTKTLTVKERINGKGFSELYTTCISDNIEGLEANMIDEYLADFSSMVEFPSNPELAKGLAYSIKYTKYSRQKMFNGNNIVFKKESGGQAVFITFLHRKNTAQKTFDLIYSYFKADFVLEPDTWIMNKGLSVAGGIFENSEDYEKHILRGITEDDMKAILAFSQLINLKSIYEQLGFKNLELPEVK